MADEYTYDGSDFVEGFIVVREDLYALAKHYFNEDAKVRFGWEFSPAGFDKFEMSLVTLWSDRMDRIESVLGEEEFEAVIADDWKRWRAEFEEYRERQKKGECCERCKTEIGPWEYDANKGLCFRCLHFVETVERAIPLIRF